VERNQWTDRLDEQPAGVEIGPASPDPKGGATKDPALGNESSEFPAGSNGPPHS
jgi:hypothetical protein